MQLSTSCLIFNLVIFTAGFYILIKGSDWFVEAASLIARKNNISEVVIGLTIVSIGTSLPELATNIYASVVGQGAIALGNVVGSNIANICLVLAIGGIISGGIPVKRDIIKRDAFVMIASFFLVFILATFSGHSSLNNFLGYFSRIDGSILLIVFILYILFLIKNSKKQNSKKQKNTDISNTSIQKTYFLLIIGLIMIFFGAKMLVDNVVWFAVRFSIPQSIIAATIIAFGTSVPELAVTITGAMKGRHDIALGNIIGSCFFNITGILGLSIAIKPINVSTDMIIFTIPIMIFSGILLIFLPWRTEKMDRSKSVILLILYFIFILYSTKHLF